MRILSNPTKEAANRRKHKLDFSRVGELLATQHLIEPDDRPLGYEHEARLKIIGRLGLKVVVLIVEPVEVGNGDIAYKPISFREAERWERQVYWPEVNR